MKRRIVLFSWFVLCVVSGCVLFVWVLERELLLDYFKIIQVPQSSIVLDRQGEELFRFFDEDRRWVAYEEIDSTMIQAIIATEDQTFRSNPGFDIWAIARAFVHNIRTRNTSDASLQGGSTITQQLVKNIYLTNEKTLKRKLQEVLLAWRLTRQRTMQYRNAGYTRQEARMRAKQTILAAYLNVVYFGNQSYGIDAAARHYFQTTTDQLTLLQSSMLASLPQAPSRYNPAQDPREVLGSWVVNTQTGVHEVTLLTQHQQVIEEVLTLRPLVITHDCVVSIQNRASFSLPGVSWQYRSGRKDRVLCRMREQGMIDEMMLKDAFLSARSSILYQARFRIRAPHFVFWIQRYLTQGAFFASKELTLEQLAQGGFTIYTTLDGDLQIAAETVLMEHKGHIATLGANNATLLHIGTEQGEVLSYVGSRDFFDSSIDGQVDVLQAWRQLGSTLKPLLYALVFMHYPVYAKTYVSDYPIPHMTLKNHDNMYRGRTTMGKALAGSRNIPAVRLFLAMGVEQVVSYLRLLGFTDLDPIHPYGYSLILGSGPMSILHLAQAYIQLSITGDVYPRINPLLSIVDSRGKTIYQRPSTRFVKQIPDTVAQMIRTILSNEEMMPESRRRLRNRLPVDHLALKTGTSDLKVGKKSLPRDGLSVVYTPHDLLITWAGNTDGSPMGPKAFGGELNHPILRDYLVTAVDLGAILDEPRVTTSYLTDKGKYIHTTHTSFTPRQQAYIWGGIHP